MARTRKSRNYKAGPGRPRKQGDRKAITKARRLLPLAEKRVREVLKDKNAEPRHTLRAAELVWRIASISTAPEKSGKVAPKITVEYSDEWVAPTGAEEHEPTEADA